MVRIHEYRNLQAGKYKVLQSQGMTTVTSVVKTRGGGALTQKVPVGAWHGLKNWTQWDLFAEKMGVKKDLNITKIRGQKDLFTSSEYFFWTSLKLGVNKICPKF